LQPQTGGFRWESGFPPPNRPQPFEAAKFPFGNPVLTKIGVWLGA
jgi:hypothetical protein